MTINFGAMFPSPFPAGDLNHGVAGVSVLAASSPVIPAVPRGQPVVTMPSPMTRINGLTNRQSRLDAFLGNDALAYSGDLESERLHSIERYLETWLKLNGRDESRRIKGQAALMVSQAHHETLEVLSVLRKTLIPV